MVTRDVFRLKKQNKTKKTSYESYLLYENKRTLWDKVSVSTSILSEDVDRSLVMMVQKWVRLSPCHLGFYTPQQSFVWKLETEIANLNLSYCFSPFIPSTQSPFPMVAIVQNFHYKGGFLVSHLHLTFQWQHQKAINSLF